MATLKDGASRSSSVGTWRRSCKTMRLASVYNSTRSPLTSVRGRHFIPFGVLMTPLLFSGPMHRSPGKKNDHSLLDALDHKTTLPRQFHNPEPGHTHGNLREMEHRCI